MGFRQRQRFLLKPGLTTALCGLMAVGGLPALIGHDGAISAQAQAGGMDASAGRPVDISIVNGDLAMVIKLLQQQTGMEVLLQDAGRPFGKVSVTLTHASPMKALRTIAASANATISKNEDGVYVLRAGGGGNDAADVAPMQAALPADPAPAAPAPLANTSLHKIVLQHAKPSDVMKIMRWDQYYTEINPYHNNNLETFHPDITTTGGNYLLNPNPVNNNGYNNSNSNDSAPSVPIGQGNQGGMAANRSANEANRTADPSDQAQQFPGGGFGGQQGGRGGRGGFGGGRGGFGGQQGGFGGQNGNQQQLPEGVDRIYALEGDNSLLVEATTDGYNRIKDIIKNLDIAPRQVQIKVEFVTASIADVDAFGINFSLIPHPGVSVSNNQGSSAAYSPQTDIQYAVGNLVTEMFNSLTHNRGKVVQAPLITTTNNVPATLQINTQIPYVTTTNVVGGGGNVVSNTQQNFIAVTTQLTVSPRINADDTVTLQLQPQISDTSGQPATAGGAPPITTQALQTLRTVRSGDTMVLGGFVRKSDTHQQNKIPILGDLPIIGNLFRSRFNNNVDSELLIFVTPTIIDVGGESLSSSAGPNISVAP